MHWPSYVNKTFYEFCSYQTNCSPNLLAALKDSPRTTMFLKNLAEQISKAERLVHKRRGTPVKIETIRSLIIDMSKLLLRGIEKEANNKVISEAERSRIKAEEDYIKDLDAASEGIAQGAFEGLEIEAGETKVTTEKRAGGQAD